MTMSATFIPTRHFCSTRTLGNFRSVARTKRATMKNARMCTQGANTKFVWTSLLECKPKNHLHCFSIHFHCLTLMGLSRMATDRLRLPTTSGMNDMMYVPSLLSLTLNVTTMNKQKRFEQMETKTYISWNVLGGVFVFQININSQTTMA